MKKTILFLLLVTTSFIFSQEKEEKYPQDIDKKYEVKLNVLNLIGFEFLDASYEYLINEESSFGIGTLVSFNNDRDIDEYRTFSLTPYYRRYFSNRYARGFFVEGFGMLHSYKNNNYDYYYDSYGNYYDYSNQESVTQFAVGISVGGKFVSKKGFTTEVYFGVGRNLGGDNTSLEAVGRGGISLGYRF